MDKPENHLKFNFKEKIKQFYDKLTINNSKTYLIIILVVYICYVSIYTPPIIINLLNQPIFRLLIILAIIYASQYSITLSLLLAIALAVTINLKNAIQTMEYRDNKLEHFSSAQSDSSSDSDSSDSDSIDSQSSVDSQSVDSQSVDSQSSHNSEGSQVGSDNQSISSLDDTDDDDDDEDSNNESFISNRDPTDDFAKLHNAIHQFDKFIAKK